MLVGRESERRAVNDLLAGARVGDSGVLVLAGEAGIGKTALLEDAGAGMEHMRLLRARGIESERSVPFGGLLQLLRPLLPLLDQIPEAQAGALGSALLLEPRTGAEPSRFAVGAATLSLLCRAAEDRPLAVLVDDGHLLDRPSAEALVFAARRLVSDAVAVVVALRAGEPGGEPWADLPRFVLEGLDLDAAGLLLCSTSEVPVGEARIARLHEATAGNPLALLELGEHIGRVDTAPAGSPMAVSDQLIRSFIGRVERLSGSARSALEVAAADSTSVALIYQACHELGLPQARLTEAEDAGLISVEGDRVDFRHPLVRSAVYGAAAADTRRAVHRALAAVVPQHETDRFAWHLSESASGPDETTAATLDTVAGQASARGAYAIAANAHERAAQLTVDPEQLARRLALAGEAAWLAGLTGHAVDLLDRALAGRPDPLLRAHIEELRGAVATRCGSLDEAVSILMQAARDVEATNPDVAIRLLADVIHVSFYRGVPDVAMQASAFIEELLGSSEEPRTRYLGSMASGMALIISGSGVSGSQKLREAASMLVISDDDATDHFRLPLRLQGTLWLRDPGPQREQVREAISQMRARATLGSLPYLLMHIARDDATTDRWEDAEAAYLECIRLAEETGQSTDLAVGLAGLACLHARQGRVQECKDKVAEATDLSRRNHIRLASLWLDFAQGDLASGRGDPARATVHYESLEAQLAETGLADPDQSPGPELAEAYLHLGRPDDALRVTTVFESKAIAKGEPWSLARAERARGLCESGTAGEEHFLAALEMHRETPDRYETARTELAFGARLRRERRRVDARPHLRSALTTFEELGAVPWADKAAQELQATGETVHRREASVIDELTPQERQISQLLAQGRTTRETGAALFISPKTVEYHLRHVYLKLGIRSREALTEIFGP